jgi:hypothetical protein
VENCEALHTAHRISLDVAKFGAVEFPAAHYFGPRNDLEPDVIAATLLWKPV